MLTGFAGENRTRGPVTQRLMRTLVVVEGKPPADAPARLDHRAIGFDEHLLIFQTAPQPLDKDVVQKPPFAVHADPDARRLEFIQERRTGELHTLIGVENLRPAMFGIAS